MEKKTYINPCTTIVTVSPERLVAESFAKGEGEFDAGSMTFTKGDRGSRSSRQDYNVWNDDWSN